MAFAFSHSFRLTMLGTILGLAPLLVGCGGERLPQRAPVTGRVVYRGEPVKQATVCFMSAGAARWSYGTTNELGEFTLTTYDSDDGAIVGENTVTVMEGGSPVGAEPPPPVPDPETYFKNLEEAAQRPPQLPARYAAADQTDLKVNVVAGENHPLLELHD